MRDDLKNWLRETGIHDCAECPDVTTLHEKMKIRVAPLFWQGSGGDGNRTPLVFLGGNPSLVKSPNEPKRGEGFDIWFDYYHNRDQSEKDGGITLKYWEKCNEFASSIFLGVPVRPWRDYVLLETTHCFFNKEDDLGEPAVLRKVSRKCFDRHTYWMVQKLKPMGILIFGEVAYDRFRERFRASNGLKWEQYATINLHGFDTAVMRFYHPTGRHGHKNPPSSDPIYQEFGRMIREIQRNSGN
jgi:hypothetical protein